MKQMTHPHLVPRLRKSGATSLLSQMSSRCGDGQLYFFFHMTNVHSRNVGVDRECHTFIFSAMDGYMHTAACPGLTTHTERHGCPMNMRCGVWCGGGAQCVQFVSNAISKVVT